MASSRVLTPPPTDPESRMAERLAAMEARLAALESARNLKVTPLGGFAASGAGISAEVYRWDGGRLWMMWWGAAVNTSGTPGYIGIQLVLNTTPIGVNSQVFSSGASSAPQPTVPHMQLLAPGTFWTPGETSLLGLTRQDSLTSSFTAEALFIEWPQA